MVEEKKATDVLAEILSLQKEMVGFVKNIDFTNKLILSRIKILGKDSSKNEVGVKPTVSVNETTSILSNSIKTPKTSLQVALENDEQEQMEDEMLTTEMNPEGQQRTQRYSNSVRKIPVQQRIVYQDGKNIYMANVEIFTQQGISVKKTRTNQIGKWIAALTPGEYIVKINKAETSLKPKVDINYTISVPNSDVQIELEVLKI